MTYGALAAGVESDSFLSSALGFMSYGPIGLAGLLIALVLTTASLRNVDQGRERILKLVLFLGVFCFVAALVAQYLVPPENSVIYSKQRVVLHNVVNALKAAEPKLQKITEMASDGDGCPGHRSIPHGPDMASRSSAVMSTLSDAEDQLTTVIDSLPTGK